MKNKIKVICGLCAIGFAPSFATPANGQEEGKPELPFKLQVLKSEYNKLRADGLTRLYRQSITSLRDVQAPFLRDGKLEESKAIESKIKELEAKIATLDAGKVPPAADKPADVPSPAP